MRELKQKTLKKRGCDYCLDHRKPNAASLHRCIHRECPYHELDGFETYEEFFKVTESQNPLKVLTKLQEC